MHSIEVGRGVKVTDGQDVAVISIGTPRDSVKDAVEMAHKEGVNAAHYDMIFLKPLDEDILKEVAEKSCPIITVEDGTVNGGLGGAVAEWMTSHGYNQKIIRLGIPDSFITHGSPAELKTMCGFDTNSIYEAILRVANRH